MLHFPKNISSFSVLSIIGSKCANEDEKLFKEEESIQILKILGLFKNI